MFGIYSIFEYNGEDLIEENTQKSQIINKEYWKRYQQCTRRDGNPFISQSASPAEHLPIYLAVIIQIVGIGTDGESTSGEYTYSFPLQCKVNRSYTYIFCSYCRLGIFSFLMLFITTLTAISTLVVLQLLNSGIQEANKSWFYLTIALDILAICAVLSVSETGRHRKRWSISSAILSIVCCLMQLWVCKMILNAPMIISLISSLITEESVTIQLA